MAPSPSLLEIYLNRRIGAVFLYGFSSGLPLALSGSTIQAWLAHENVAITTIGAFSLVGLPYTLKFLWSPLLDRFAPPWLDRRRSWILMSQVALAATIATTALFGPPHFVALVGVLALLTSFLSATQDIAVDAYRTDLLHVEERGAGSAAYVAAYRTAMILSGALALVFAEGFGWRMTYLMLAALMGLCAAANLIAPKLEQAYPHPATLTEAVVGPMRQWFSRPAALSLLALVVLYRLADSAAASLAVAFLIKGLGFSQAVVGTVSQGLGLAATLLGAAFGGAWLARLGLFRSLLLFGVLQAVSNLAYMGLALVGQNFTALCIAVAIENLTSGMGMAAFIAFLMALCDHRFSATQFALLTALSSIGRVFIGPAAGLLVEHTNWSVFFLTSAFFALPGILLLWSLRKELRLIGNS